MDKKDQKVKVFGVDVPKYEDCKQCGAEAACNFVGIAYDQPCANCKNTPEYEAQAAKKGRTMDDMLKTNQVAGVFTGYGRDFYVNHKGDVIKDEKAKPLTNGRANWK